MKVSVAITLVILLFAAVKADLEIATSFDDVAKFLEINNAQFDNTDPNLIDETEDDTVGLLFIDSTLNSQASGGFLSGVVTSITSVFSGAGDATTQQSIADIEKELSDETRLMQIDVSNENLKGIQESYDVTDVPYLIIFKRGIVVLKEVPNQNTRDKILQILNVNPASLETEVSNEENVAVESSPEAASSEVIEATSEQPEELAEVSVEEISEEPAVIEVTEEVPEESVEEIQPVETNEIVIEETPEEIVILEDENATVPDETETSPEPTPGSLSEPDKAFANEIDGSDLEGIPRSFELGPRPGAGVVLEGEEEPPQITLAPGETARAAPQPTPTPRATPRPAVQRPPQSVVRQQLRGQVQEQPKAQVEEKPREHINPDERRKVIYHRCHGLESGEDCNPLVWRHTPSYIPELEDYEVPEDWWRNGYAPLEGENAADKATRYEREHCVIPPPPKETYIEEPKQIVIERPHQRVEVRPVVIQGPHGPVTVQQQVIIETPVIETPVVVETPVVETPVVVENPVVENPVIVQTPNTTETPVVVKIPSVESPVVIETPVSVETPVVENPVTTESPVIIKPTPVVVEQPQQIIIEKPVPVYIEKEVPVYVNRPGPVHNQPIIIETEDEKCTCETPPPPPPVPCPTQIVTRPEPAVRPIVQPRPVVVEPKPIVQTRPHPQPVLKEKLGKPENCTTAEPRKIEVTSGAVVGNRLSAEHGSRVVQAPRTSVVQAPRTSVVQAPRAPVVAQRASVQAFPKYGEVVTETAKGFPKYAGKVTEVATEKKTGGIKTFPRYNADETK